jgi:hypothetical protein
MRTAPRLWSVSRLGSARRGDLARHRPRPGAPRSRWSRLARSDHAAVGVVNRHPVTSATADNSSVPAVAASHRSPDGTRAVGADVWLARTNHSVR